MGEKLDLLHWGKNIGWGCWRVECWGWYFGVRGRKWKETGGNCIVRGCMIGTACQVLLGWSCKEETGSACGMCGEEVKCIQGFGRENWKRAVARPRHKWEDIVKIELKRVWIRASRMDWSDWGQGWVVGCWEYGNEPSGIIKYGECRGWLKNCQLLKKSCASCSLVIRLFGLSVRSACHLQFLIVNELCGSVTDKLRVVQLVTDFPTFM